MKTLLEERPTIEKVSTIRQEMPTVVETDAMLIEMFEAGDRQASDRLVRRYYGPAMKIAYGFVANRDVAQDIVQDAFAKAFRGLDGYDRTRPFGTWFFRIVTNQCIDKLRRRRYRMAVSLETAREYNLEPPVDGPTRADKDETREAVRNVMGKLPEKYLEVLTLRDLNDFTCERIAAMLGISTSTVRWRLATARRMFKELWRVKYAD